ncbi:MAG: hypothetical protein AB1402_00425 [Bacillota bacterium]
MKKRVGAFQIASAYIGVTIGAGFASGQEVLQFFTFFGPNAILAIILASMLFVFFGAVILDLGRRLNAKSHLEVLRHSGGKHLSILADAVTTFFLFGSFAAMTAGTAAVFAQQFGFPTVWGSVAMVAVSAATVVLGLRALVSALSFVVPLLLVVVVGVVALTLAANPVTAAGLLAANQPWNAPVPNWALSAVTYVSYNIVIAVAVLAPLGALAARGRALNQGALAGGIGLGVGMLAINLAIVAVPQAGALPIPMAFVAAIISPFFGFIYSFALLAAIYTTAVGALYGFAARLAPAESTRFRITAILAGSAALFASQLGFQSLVRYLYSAVGIVGIVLLVGLTYTFVRERYRELLP